MNMPNQKGPRVTGRPPLIWEGRGTRPAKGAEVLKNMKLGARIACGFGLVLVLLVVTGSMLAVSLR